MAAKNNFANRPAKEQSQMRYVNFSAHRILQLIKKKKKKRLIFLFNGVKLCQVKS